MTIEHLDRPIAFQRAFVTVTGSITAALFLSQAVYWARRCLEHEDGERWFYKTQSDWEDETGMTRYEQEGARKVLRGLGLLKEKRVGIPAKLYFSIDGDALEAAIKASATTQPSMRKTSKLVSGKPANSSAENQQSITENTTETTTEIKSTDGDNAIPQHEAPSGTTEQKTCTVDCQAAVDEYHRQLPNMPAVRELTDSRKTKLRNFWRKSNFNPERWSAYLGYIAENCRWMSERRPRRDGESQWKPKNFDYLITERCYLGVREGRFDD